MSVSRENKMETVMYGTTDAWTRKDQLSTYLVRLDIGDDEALSRYLFVYFCFSVT